MSNNAPDYQSNLVFPPEQKRERLLQRLATLKKAVEKRDASIEWAHSKADDLLLEYINDREVSKAFSLVPKWYA